MNDNRHQYYTAAMGKERVIGIASAEQANVASFLSDKASGSTTNDNNKIKPNMVSQNQALSPPRPLWRNGEKTFPYKVYDMLEYAETSGATNICSWLSSGDSFVIYDRKLFTEYFLPRFFLHKKWRSFTRQLNIWSFKRDLSVIVPDAYCHKYFRRGDVDQLAFMERTESKNLFKKDPITNKRKLKSADKKDCAKRQRVASPASCRDQEDVNEVATFLAGLKSSPKTPAKPPASCVASPVPVTNSVVGTSTHCESVGTISSSNSSINNMELRKARRAMIASRLNMLSQQSHISLPYPSGYQAHPSLPAIPPSQVITRMCPPPRFFSASSIPLNTATVAATGPVITGVDSNMDGQDFCREIGTFDRESLNRLGTGQLLELASHMKLREQLLRERAQLNFLRHRDQQASMHPAAPVRATSLAGGWRDHLGNIQEHRSNVYREILRNEILLQQSRGGGERMMQDMTCLFGSNKPHFGDIGAVTGLQPPTHVILPNISNIANKYGYPRAA